MIKGLYSIRDAKTCYSDPIPMRNDAEAMRWFSNLCKDGLIGNNQEDFSLYFVGYFDDVSADIYFPDPDNAEIKCICKGTDFPNKKGDF